MPILPDYNAFEGRHWETGTICNALAYQGVTAPHNGQPLSEALLMGISGGAAFGYFTFEYEGYDPIVSILTRNTFDPMETLLQRLPIPHEVIQTTSAKTGARNLVEALEGGRPAITWADMDTLPYNARKEDAGNWAMLPVLVYGHDGDTVYIADRSRKPLLVNAEVFAKARARIKKFKYRIITLDIPDLSNLAAAVQKGIWQSISLYTEKPPKGSKNNFGFAAYQKLANMLTNTRNKQSWARLLPPGRRMYVALSDMFMWTRMWGAGNGAERVLYADFLDEAVQILDKPELADVATQFRQSSAAWCDLGDALLPENVPLLKETRELMWRKHTLFMEQGDQALDEIRAVNVRLDAIKNVVSDEFPMSDTEVVSLRQELSDQVMKIHDIERAAIDTLVTAMG